jgi:S1-C subfamily serine protease
MRNSFLFRLGAIALVGVMLIATWQGFPLLLAELFGSGSPRAVTPRGDLAADEQSTIALFENARGSVAYIATTERVVDPFTRNPLQVPRGSGSGFFWDNLGHVVTNHHVIAGAGGATVRLADGRAYEATLVASSPDHDLAVLRVAIPTGRPAPLPIASSAELRVGQKVFAIGNPFGLDWTLTTGVISALNRELPGDNGGTIEGLIQTDAAINPGNSGGPLLDSAGRLIGVNTAIYSPSGAYAGVGFAVPVDTVNRVVPRLIADGRYVRPTLGIRMEEQVNEAITQRLGIEGVVVLGVAPGSPAAQAGLRPASRARNGGLTLGDVITAIGDRPVKRVSDLSNALDRMSPGQPVTLTVLRDGRSITVTTQVEAAR